MIPNRTIIETGFFFFLDVTSITEIVIARLLLNQIKIMREQKQLLQM